MDKLHIFLRETVGDMEKWVWIGIKVLIIYIVALIASKIAKQLFKHWMRKYAQQDKTNLIFLRNFVTYTIYFIAFIAMMNMLPGFEKVGKTLLAGAGILAAIIGFASQEALSNIVSGLFMVIFKPFRVGDTINVGNGLYLGTVEDISLRHTTIRNVENRMVIIPNNKLSAETITNSSIVDSATCAMVEMGIGYTVNIDKAMELITEEALKHPLTIDHRTSEQKETGEAQIIIRVMAWGESAIQLRASVWAASSGNAFILKCDLLKTIKDRFDKEGVEIPYPYRNVIVKNQ